MLEALGVNSAIFVGVSRGGLHTFMLANHRPELVKAVVLNDIGPQLDPEGLARIKGYIGRLPLLRDLDAAVAHYKSTMGAFFPAASDDDWRFYAQNSLNATPERMRLSYDPQLARTLDSFDPDAPPPDFWPQFAAVKAPMLALRGEFSDLLTPEIHAEMAARLPSCQTPCRARPGPCAFAVRSADAGADRRIYRGDQTALRLTLRAAGKFRRAERRGEGAGQRVAFGLDAEADGETAHRRRHMGDEFRAIVRDLKIVERRLADQRNQPARTVGVDPQRGGLHAERRVQA